MPDEHAGLPHTTAPNPPTLPAADVTSALPAAWDGGLPANMQARIQQAVQRATMLGQIMREVLKEGVDYGTVPGAQKPTLYQAGAQQLFFVFGFTPIITLETLEQDFDRNPPLISATARCRLIHRETGECLAEALATCNTWEQKYRYRGKGADRRINMETADLQNTIVKMAAKRAKVAAVLDATGASRLFTQDLEDMGPANPDGVNPGASSGGTARQSTTRARSTTSGSDGKASKPQQGKIWALQREAGLTKEDLGVILRDKSGGKRQVDDLTTREASAVIDHLNKLIAARQQPMSDSDDSPVPPEAGQGEDVDVPF